MCHFFDALQAGNGGKVNTVITVESGTIKSSEGCIFSCSTWMFGRRCGFSQGPSVSGLPQSATWPVYSPAVGEKVMAWIWWILNFRTKEWQDGFFSRIKTVFFVLGDGFLFKFRSFFLYFDNVQQKDFWKSNYLFKDGLYSLRLSPNWVKVSDEKVFPPSGVKSRPKWTGK